MYNSLEKVIVHLQQKTAEIATTLLLSSVQFNVKIVNKLGLPPLKCRHRQQEGILATEMASNWIIHTDQASGKLTSIHLRKLLKM